MASTTAVGRLIKAGMKEVNYLNAIIHNKYARTPDKLRAWASASHIERAPQREKKPAGGTPPAPGGSPLINSIPLSLHQTMFTIHP